MNKNYEEWGATGRGSKFESKLGELRNLRDLEMLTATHPQTPKAKTPASVVEMDERAKLLYLIDKETVLYSRAHFNQTFKYEITRAQRYRRLLSICIISIDNVDAVSEQLGSSGFQYFISSLADLFKKSLRGVDFPARYSKDHFIVILPETNAEGTTAAAERIRALFKSSHLSYGNKAAPVCCSIGCACFPGHATYAQDLIDSATRSLEVAHERGGDMVCML